MHKTLSKRPSPLLPQSGVQKGGYLWELTAKMLASNVYMQRLGDRSMYSSKHLKNSAGLPITFNCGDMDICVSRK